MFKDLSPGTKISISRSISTVFEQYMSEIGWNENKFDMQTFFDQWRKYITANSSWYDKISDDVKNNPTFHEQLAVKINETIDKILSEEPTKEQMDEIEKLQKEAGEELDYSCKSEAKYVIELLKEKVKKAEQLMPASDKMLKLASLMYYQVYEKELPLYDYRQQDIAYIIEQLDVKIREGKEIFETTILH